MIQITIVKNRILIHGHANYAPEGKDIVCASVSILAHNLIGSIESLTKDTIKYNISPGRVDIDLRDISAESELLVRSFFCGVEDIAAEYPDNVRVTMM